jgi:hypothetical protein
LACFVREPFYKGSRTGWSWSQKAYWAGREVLGGVNEFHIWEPENRYLLGLIEQIDPSLVIFYHCCVKNGVVYENTIPSATTLSGLYQTASGYGYEPGVPGITGDAIDYLGYVKGIAGLEVELPQGTNRVETDFDANWYGLLAVIGYFSDL